jgi:hypothetical protein
MTDEALIAWLRSLKGLGWSNESADRIEYLVERNKELALQLLATQGQAAEAEAKLEKAVELLKLYVDIDDVGGCERAALAEIKGDSDAKRDL